MDVNYKYFWHYITKQDDYKNLKVLDYGCGRGEILSLLLKEGIDACGVDIYHCGPSEEVLNSDLYKTGKIKIIKNGERLPFDDNLFDLIISNQVFEHVADINFVISELSRILKKNGKMYHHFPSKEVWREGHIGVLFSHWLPKFSKIRYCYIYFFRLLGFGYNKNGLSKKDWARKSFDYLNNYCYYRPYKDLKKIFSEYGIKHQEIEYIKYRGQNNIILKKLVKIKFFKNFYQRLFRKLAFMVIELRKK